VSDSFTPREAVADALPYWEPRRIIYNVAVAAVVAGHFAAAWPASSATLTVNLLLGLFLLALLANICYCAVHAVDLFVQLSGLQESRSKGRIDVLIVGTAFGAVIAHFFATNMFASS